MSHHETHIEPVKTEFKLNKQVIGYFFLGVGLTMFLVNIVSIISFLNIAQIRLPLTGYYISIISSIFLMTYSVYNIYDTN